MTAKTVTTQARMAGQPGKRQSQTSFAEEEQCLFARRP